MWKYKQTVVFSHNGLQLETEKWKAGDTWSNVDDYKDTIPSGLANSVMYALGFHLHEIIG